MRRRAFIREGSEWRTLLAWRGTIKGYTGSHLSPDLCLLPEVVGQCCVSYIWFGYGVFIHSLGASIPIFISE